MAWQYLPLTWVISLLSIIANGILFIAFLFLVSLSRFFLFDTCLGGLLGRQGKVKWKKIPCNGSGNKCLGLPDLPLLVDSVEALIIDIQEHMESIIGRMELVVMYLPRLKDYGLCGSTAAAPGLQVRPASALTISGSCSAAGLCTWDPTARCRTRPGTRQAQSGKTGWRRG